LAAFGKLLSMQSLQLLVVTLACLTPGSGLTSTVFSDARTRTLEWMVLLQREDAPIGTKPSAAWDCSGAVARIGDRECRRSVCPRSWTQLRRAPTGELVNPVTRTMSSLGSVLVRKTSTPVT